VEQERKNVALRLPPQFGDAYAEFEEYAKEKHGYEAKRCFTDALLELYLDLPPGMMVAIDNRADQIRTMVSPRVFDDIIEFLETSEHRVKFSVFSYNALSLFFEDDNFRGAVEAQMVLNLYNKSSVSSSATKRPRQRRPS